MQKLLAFPISPSFFLTCILNYTITVFIISPAWLSREKKKRKAAKNIRLSALYSGMHLHKTWLLVKYVTYITPAGMSKTHPQPDCYLKRQRTMFDYMTNWPLHSDFSKRHLVLLPYHEICTLDLELVLVWDDWKRHWVSKQCKDYANYGEHTLQ